MSDWIWTMVQAIVVIVTLPLIYRQVRLQTASHMVQSLGSIHQRWTEDAMLRARHSVCSRYLSNTLTFDGVSEYIAEYMEELGVYLQTGALPRGVMWEVQSWYVEHYYCMLKDGIHALRNSYHDETIYSNTEKLFDHLRAHSRKAGSSTTERGPEDLRRFAEDEVLIAMAFLNLRVDQEQALSKEGALK